MTPHWPKPNLKFPNPPSLPEAFSFVEESRAGSFRMIGRCWTGDLQLVLVKPQTYKCAAIQFERASLAWRLYIRTLENWFTKFSRSFCEIILIYPGNTHAWISSTIIHCPSLLIDQTLWRLGFFVQGLCVHILVDLSTWMVIGVVVKRIILIREKQCSTKFCSRTSHFVAHLGKTKLAPLHHWIFRHSRSPQSGKRLLDRVVGEMDLSFSLWLPNLKKKKA